jgi:integrase
MAKKPRLRSPKGDGGVFLRGNSWWYKFAIDGTKYTGPTGALNESDARFVKNQKMAEVQRGEVGPSAPGEATIGELLRDYLAYVKGRGKPSGILWVENKIGAILLPHFDKLRAASLTTRDLQAWREKRRATVEDTTINRDMAILRAAFNYGRRQTPPKVAATPYFPLVREDNARQGFLEEADYRLVLEHTPACLKPLLATAYWTGARKGELIMLKWKQVDLAAGFIELQAPTTKNRAGRYLPIIEGDMAELLAAQKEFRDTECPETPWVFFWYGAQHHRPVGSRITGFRGSWDATVEKAGFSGLLFHDLRRSGVRNMIQGAGVSEKQAMLISGHKTRSMIDRYNIGDRRSVQEAGKRISQHFKDKKKAV